METKYREKTHAGLFTDKTSAESAYAAAIKRGYKPEEINVLMSEDTRKKYYPETVVTEKGDKSMEGLAIGGALGGTVVGTLAAIIALTSTIVVPGVGLVIAGPLAAGLVGAGAGSIAGGLVGALVGLGIPEERATIYEKGIKRGGIVLNVTSRSTETDNSLLEDWRKNKGTDIF